MLRCYFHNKVQVQLRRIHQACIPNKNKQKEQKNFCVILQILSQGKVVLNKIYGYMQIGSYMTFFFLISANWFLWLVVKISFPICSGFSSPQNLFTHYSYANWWILDVSYAGKVGWFWWPLIQFLSPMFINNLTAASHQVRGLYKATKWLSRC